MHSRLSLCFLKLCSVFDMAIRCIINYYERHPHVGCRLGAHRTRVIVPTQCKMCGRYVKGKCHRAFSDGFAQCRNGLFVFCDVESDLVFWGMSVDGKYDSRKVHCVDGVVAGSREILHGLILSELKTRSAISLFSDLVAEMRNVDQNINAIDSSFSDSKGLEDKIVNVRAQNVIKATAAAGTLAEIRRRVHERIMPFVSDDFLNTGSNFSLCLLTPRCCVDCQEKSCCECSDSVLVQKCTQGVEFIKVSGMVSSWVRRRGGSAGDKMFRLRLSGVDCRCPLRIATYVLQRYLILRPIRRFLHDAGQYISGLQNVLPQSSGEHSLQMMLADIRTVIALSVALRFLKTCFEIKVYKRKVPSPRYISLYRTFDRYRYCFSNRDLRIELVVCPPEKNFFKQVRCAFGFERIILNLFGNAVKYLPSEQRKITVLFSETNYGANIKVDSFGAQLERDELKKLGRHCFRGRLARENFDGEGMGLCVVREYVESSGMEIEFDQTGPVRVFDGIPYQMFSVVLRMPMRLIRNEPDGYHEFGMC